MAKRHTNSIQKPSGGRSRRYRKPKKHEQGGDFTATTVGEENVERTEATGNKEKLKVKSTGKVNLAVDGEVEPAEIEAVLENPANPDYVRRNVLTRGAVVRTDKGKARVTSRPGQEGTVNAVLVDEE
ncbi:MAG: 30S ribosomal protein S8e [Candidatus Nanohaloarchaeota archaeon QJJ-7]|nr:30S ribosomal protein S8e [Candidatus Nanohaloarchaeota archaeon QJJ-7]